LSSFFKRRDYSSTPKEGFRKDKREKCADRRTQNAFAEHKRVCKLFIKGRLLRALQVVARQGEPKKRWPREVARTLQEEGLLRPLYTQESLGRRRGPEGLKGSFFQEFSFYRVVGLVEL